MSALERINYDPDELIDRAAALHRRKRQREGVIPDQPARDSCECHPTRDGHAATVILRNVNGFLSAWRWRASTDRFREVQPEGNLIGLDAWPTEITSFDHVTGTYTTEPIPVSQDQIERVGSMLGYEVATLCTLLYHLRNEESEHVATVENVCRGLISYAEVLGHRTSSLDACKENVGEYDHVRKGGEA